MLVLVRHAHPHLPAPDGPDDLHRGLTPEGEAEAAALAESLAATAPVRVVSSPYLRAVQTVRPLAAVLGLTVETDHDLREWASGIDPRPDYARFYAESWADPDRIRPGGESLADLSARAVDALTALAGDRTVVVGSHGTFVARALVGFGLTGLGWEFCRRMPMPAVYRLCLGPGRVVARGPGLRLP